MAETVELEISLDEKIELETNISPADVTYNGYHFIGVKDQIITGNTITLVDLPIP